MKHYIADHCKTVKLYDRLDQAMKQGMDGLAHLIWEELITRSHDYDRDLSVRELFHAGMRDALEGNPSRQSPEVEYLAGFQTATLNKWAAQ